MLRSKAVPFDPEAEVEMHVRELGHVDTLMLEGWQTGMGGCAVVVEYDILPEYVVSLVLTSAAVLLSDGSIVKGGHRGTEDHASTL